MLRASGHEHFNGSLVIPVIDEQGNVTEVYGRKITRRPARRHAVAPVSARAGIARRVERGGARGVAKEIILCEALIDALTFWCAGFRNVTAAYGVEGFTDDHLAAFKKHGTERVLIAYDRDDAGERAAEKLGAAVDGRRHRVLAHPVPARDGRERVRTEGDTGGQVAWCRDPQGAVAWQG